MHTINLIRTRHIETLVVPSHGEILISYLSCVSETMNTAVPAESASWRRRRESGIQKTEEKTEHVEVLRRIFSDTESVKQITKNTKNSPFSIPNSVFASRSIPRSLTSALLVVSLGGITGPIIPEIRLETKYILNTLKTNIIQQTNPAPVLPPSAPIIFDPLLKPEGEKIIPINTDFSVIVPKVGINAAVISSVDPKSETSYLPALSKGVAHASTSFLPDQDGTVYLFSHSTNYDWFVKDLNAVFYHLKSLDTGDLIVVVYKNVRYTYKLREKKIVAPSEISYLLPQHGTKTLILQTCWPPGSIADRLLIFADLFETQPLTN